MQRLLSKRKKCLKKDYFNLMKLSSWYVCIAIGLGLFFLDLVTKQLVIHYLPSPHELFIGKGQDIVIFQHFLGISCSITHAVNTGAAWGYFGDFPHLLLVLRIFLISCLACYLIFWPVPGKFRLPLILILSGAIGNVLDFFLYGHVIDMLHFVFWGYDYPVFNVADSLIFIGTFLILFMTIREKETC